MSFLYLQENIFFFIYMWLGIQFFLFKGTTIKFQYSEHKKKEREMELICLTVNIDRTIRTIFLSNSST